MEVQENSASLQHDAALWRYHREKVQELWWQNFIGVPEPPSREELLESAALCDLTLEGMVQPVCFRFHPEIPEELSSRTDDDGAPARRQEKHMEQLLKDQIRLVCFAPDFQVQILSVSHSMWMLLLFSEAPQPEQAKLDCEKLTGFCREQSMLCMCLPGYVCALEELHGELRRLEQLARDIVYLDNRVMPVQRGPLPDVLPPQPNMEHIMLLIDCGMYQEAMNEVRAFFSHEDVVPRVDSWFLENFRFGFLNGIRNLETVRKAQMDIISMIPPHQLQFSAETVPDLLGMIQDILSAMMCMPAHDRSQPRLAAELQSYIRDHLDEELSRNTLALHFYISADYLDRIFKKECGITITDYILQTRLEVACTLLKNENLTVTEIASKLGFVNFSYFSTIFKKHCGMTPNAWRKQHRESDPG